MALPACHLVQKYTRKPENLCIILFQMNNACNRIQRQLAFDAYELLNLLEDIISGLNDVNTVRRAVHMLMYIV